MADALPRFAEIDGHDAVRQLLQNASRQDRLAHALLFAGADGIGKRSFTQAFIAWLTCTERGDDACGQCAACRQLAAGSHPDVKWIGLSEKKKEIGVDRAREIKRFAQLRPAAAPQKAIVVDPAQCLNVAAQNALLKTLEDPPLRSILILIANNADALLPTVRSRCQRLNFRPLPQDLVARILVEKEGLAAGKAGELAAVAEGSPGRALALQRYLGQ
ncbi:MAG TPA: DNA polymerase III subunit delta', partial [Terriglobales bacterium]|nr:DNA polymerase III subunit delta' [Terriglobales bacterium]